MRDHTARLLLPLGRPFPSSFLHPPFLRLSGASQSNTFYYKTSLISKRKGFTPCPPTQQRGNYTGLPVFSQKSLGTERQEENLSTMKRPLWALCQRSFVKDSYLFDIIIITKERLAFLQVKDTLVTEETERMAFTQGQQLILLQDLHSHPLPQPKLLGHGSAPTVTASPGTSYSLLTRSRSRF